MNLCQKNRSALWIAVAGALALNLAACGPQGTSDKASRDMDRTTANASRQLDRTPQTPPKAVQQAEQPAGASSEKSAETGKGFDDMALSGKVKSALIADPNLRSMPIDVEAEKGVVTLKGRVKSDSDRADAANVVSTVEGVKAVKNDLIVASSS